MGKKRKDYYKGCQCRPKQKLELISVVPFQMGNSKISSLLAYFLHEAPNIESIHSPIIHKSIHDEIIYKMFENRKFIEKKFCAFNCKIEEELKKYKLDGEEICLGCERFLCKYEKPRNNIKETDLECLLRHIRNSIAHGRVYYKHCGNRIQIMFEDRNQKNKVTARIVCINADLKHWKYILEGYSMKYRKNS
ncbi:MAG TPA: hypothetical protein IAD08_00310 [Candidatus Scatovivens faecipullorum]|jgi:hypothetical protein|nr:hypothetical protein [Candidatus Scatovivens faecipullorum]